jgi:Guanylate-binding protein, N-terminal domain
MLKFSFIFVIFFVGLTVIKAAEGNSTTENNKVSSIFYELKGIPLNLLWVTEEEKDNFTGQIVVNFMALGAILLHSEVTNRKIVVVSITGPIKTGKSFLMNYCLRFLYANVSCYRCR